MRTVGRAIAAAVVTLVALGPPSRGAPPPSFPPLRHGIKAVFGRNGNDHGGDLENKGKRLGSAFHDLGVVLTRIEFKWAIIEPQRGRYDWSEPDRLINFLHAHGIEPMLMLYCAPKWAMRGTPADEQLFIARGERNLHTVVWPRRQYLPDFERFCEAAARRYAGKARLLEFWNEPDGMAGPIVYHDKRGRAVDVRYGGDAAEYTRWLEAMYRAVKRGNPDAQVAAGSLCVHDLEFIEAIYAAGGGPFCDAVSLHPYADTGVNLPWIRRVRSVMTRYGDWSKPIWLTEFGWTHGGQYDEATESFSPQADTVARLITATFPTIIELPYVTHSFFFTLNDWQTGEGGIDPPGTHGFGLLDMTFHRRPGFETFKRVVAATPQIPRRAETPVATIAPPRGPIDLTPDRSLSFQITYFDPDTGLTQPAPTARRVRLRLEAPDLLPEPCEIDLPLAPRPGGDIGKLAGAGPTATPLPVRLRAAAAASPGTWPMSVSLAGGQPVDCLVTVPATAGAWRQPPTLDGDLREWGDRLDIERGEMKAGFGWDERRLYFACCVTDAGHQDRHRARDLWKNDCVQLAFDPRRDAVRGSRYDVNDTEYALALAGGQTILWRYICPPDSYVGVLPVEYLAVRRLGDRTFYEAAIPWSEIGLEAIEDGQVIGVAVAACDWTGSRRTVHRFGDGIIGGKEPYRFGSIRLQSGPLP